MNFIDILKSGKKQEIKNTIENQQKQFLKENKDIELDLGYAIPNYDILMNILKCDDCGTPIIDESFGNDLYFKVLRIFQSGLKDTYFCRLEEYGPGDVDAMKCSIIITKKIKEKSENIIKEYIRKSIINEKNKRY